MADEVMVGQGQGMPFDEYVSHLRKGLRAPGEAIKALKQHGIFTTNPVTDQDRGEMMANIMLAYRHWEDAIMRLGKAIQAYDGGKSVYDK